MTTLVTDEFAITERVIPVDAPPILLAASALVVSLGILIFHEAVIIPLEIEEKKGRKHA